MVVAEERMANLSKIYIMAVFGVKYRNAMLVPEIRNQMHASIRKILEEHGKGSHCLKVGGVDDHVHILFTLSSNISVSDLIREVKSRSSRWLNEQHLIRYKFEWQAGYGAFSYSQSAVEAVKRYIDNQDIHHHKRSFREEITEMAEKYQIISDSRDLPADPI